MEAGDRWIDANFEETEIGGIRPCQPVRVEIDTYPGNDRAGRLVSPGVGSGPSFSLLPARNATGNWVEVTQRFPVRIALDADPDDPARQLRVGASARVRVDTTSDSTIASAAAR